MIWERTSTDPITTESRVVVENEDGTKGFVNVRWSNGIVSLYGSVYKSLGVDEESGEEEVEVIDRNPSISGFSLPPKGRDPRRSIRVPDSEWESWKEAAYSQGSTVAMWLRDLANKAANRHKAAK